MSLEHDITQIKEADIFKGASKEELEKRHEAHVAAMKAKGIKPVDDAAIDADGKVWTATDVLLKRLEELRAQYHDEECQCSEVLDAVGEEMEYCVSPGENGYLNAFCLRCGGRYDPW